jgi:hypothetical protein
MLTDYTAEDRSLLASNQVRLKCPDKILLPSEISQSLALFLPRTFLQNSVESRMDSTACSDVTWPAGAITDLTVPSVRHNSVTDPPPVYQLMGS